MNNECIDPVNEFSIYELCFSYPCLFSLLMFLLFCFICAVDSISNWHCLQIGLSACLSVSTSSSICPSIHCRQSGNKQAVGGWPPRYAPAPLLPPWAPKRLTPPSRRQSSSSFPRPTRSHAHRCSRLMWQHGSEQSGLMTLFNLWPFDLESGVRVKWRGLPLCQSWSS